MSKQIHLLKSKKPFIDRSENVLRYYGDINSCLPLSQAETDELFRQYHKAEGKEKELIRNKIFKHNSRLVVSMAREFCNCHESLLDLIEEGNIGLLNAIDAYDLSLPSCFQKIAMFYIRRSINMYKQEFGSTVLKTNRGKTNFRTRKITSDFLQKEERYPTSEELLELYNKTYPKAHLKEKMDFDNVTYVEIDGFDVAPTEDEKIRMSNFVNYNNASSNINSIESNIEDENTKYKVQQLLEYLKPREQRILKLYFGLEDSFEHGYDSIGKILGLTSTRVGQIFNNAIKKLSKLDFKESC